MIMRQNVGVLVEDWRIHFFWKSLLTLIVPACFCPIKAENSEMLARVLPPPCVDRFGDPLPREAIARMGTVRFREAYRIITMRCLPGGRELLTITPLTVHHWDIVTGKSLQTTEIHESFEKVEAAPDGKMLASGHRDGTIRLLDSGTGKQLFALRGHRKPITSIAFEMAGKLLASGSDDGEIRVWDLDTHALLMRPFGHSSEVKDLQFSRDRKLLASQGHDNIVRFWDVASGKELSQLRIQDENIRRIAFSPVGETMALSRTGDKIVIYDVFKRKDVRTITGTADELVFSPNGCILASVNEDGIIFWETKTGKRIRALCDGATSAAFSPDGKYLMSAINGTIRKWEVASGREVDSRDAHIYSVDNIAVSQNSDIVASLDGVSTLNVWESRTGKRLRTSRLNSDVRSTSFSRNLSKIALGFGSGNIFIRDPLSGTLLFSLSSQERKVSTLSFSPGGKLLASTCGEQEDKPLVHLWDMDSKRLLYTVKHSHSILSMAISPRRRLLAIGDSTGRISLYNYKTGELQNTFFIQGYVRSISFCADDNYLAVPLWRKFGFIRLWNLDSCSPIDLAGTPGEIIYCLATSPDGSLLATGDSSGQVIIWETLTWKRIQTLRGHQGVVACMAFSGNGRALVTGGNDTTLLLWDLSLPPSRIVSPANKLLSPEEAEQLWQSLAEADPVKAHSALRIMVAQGEPAVAFLNARLSPIPDNDLQSIRGLIDKLDDAQFSVRQSAMDDLKKLGSEASPLLRHSLILSPSLEAQNRIKSILRSAQAIQSTETLRKLRSIQVLELINSSDARSVLKRLSLGTPWAIQTIYAKAALARISSR